MSTIEQVAAGALLAAALASGRLDLSAYLPHGLRGVSHSFSLRANGALGWDMMCRLLAALERSGLWSLAERPIEIGEGRDGFVIV